MVEESDMVEESEPLHKLSAPGRGHHLQDEAACPASFNGPMNTEIDCDKSRLQLKFRQHAVVSWCAQNHASVSKQDKGYVGY